MAKLKLPTRKGLLKNYYVENEETTLAADPVVGYLSKEELVKMAERTRKAMEKAAKELEFMEAAKLRDEYMALQKMIESR